MPNKLFPELFHKDEKGVYIFCINNKPRAGLCPTFLGGINFATFVLLTSFVVQCMSGKLFLELFDDDENDIYVFLHKHDIESESFSHFFR